MRTTLKLAFRVHGTYVPTLQSYCDAYLAPRLSPEEIADCIRTVYFQVWCIYFEQNRDPATKDLLHTDEVGHNFLVIEDYALKVFVEISKLEHICILLDAIFI